MSYAAVQKNKIFCNIFFKLNNLNVQFHSELPNSLKLYITFIVAVLF